MSERTIEDRLREEYFSLVPDMRRVVEWLEAEVRHCILPVSLNLATYEQLEVKSRIKGCESALNSLRLKQEGATLDSDAPEQYTLTGLKDLAGVRVLAFPRTRLTEVHEILRSRFSTWEPDHIPGTEAHPEPIAHKYHGYCEASDKVKGELQIVSMLVGLYWEVEHSAFYKLEPRYKGVERYPELRDRDQDVLEALRGFEEEFENLLLKSGSSI